MSKENEDDKQANKSESKRESMSLSDREMELSFVIKRITDDLQPGNGHGNLPERRWGLKRRFLNRFRRHKDKD
jgi:hypothetical protein